MPPPRDERDGVQIDLYGVRMTAVPSPVQGDEPRTWREVVRGINKDLMAVVSNTFSLLADTLRSARSLVRGVGAVPGAVAARLQESHTSADRAAERQTAEATYELAHSRDEAIEEIRSLLRRKRVEGLTAEILFEKKHERLVICILPPTEPEEVRRIAAAGVALSLPDAAMSQASSSDGVDDSAPRKRKRRRKKRAESNEATPETAVVALEANTTPRKRRRRRRGRGGKGKPTESS